MSIISRKHSEHGGLTLARSLKSVSWSSEDVKRIFLAATDGQSSRSQVQCDTSNTRIGSGSGSATGPSPNGNTDGQSSTAVGAIAGGVVGGVAALALIGAAVWWCLRRKKQQQASVDPIAVSELAASTDRPGEKYTYVAPQEVGSPMHQELYAHHVSPGDSQELYGNGSKAAPNNYHELYGQTSPVHAPAELDSTAVQRR